MTKPLSPRQREILSLIARGKRDKDIAFRLEISERTVAHHIERTLIRLGALNRAHAVWLFFVRSRE